MKDKQCALCSNRTFIITGWWFGTFSIFPYTGKFIIPIDESSYFSEGFFLNNQIIHDLSKHRSIIQVLGFHIQVLGFHPSFPDHHQTWDYGIHQPDLAINRDSIHPGRLLLRPARKSPVLALFGRELPILSRRFRPEQWPGGKGVAFQPFKNHETLGGLGTTTIRVKQFVFCSSFGGSHKAGYIYIYIEVFFMRPKWYEKPWW